MVTARRSMKIVTQYVHPPIPARTHDWAAYFDNDNCDDHRTGYGPTEAAAVADLLEQLED